MTIKQTKVNNRLDKINSDLAEKRNKTTKINSSDLDISSDTNKIRLINLSDEVQKAMSGDAPVNPVIPNKGVTKEKYADSSIEHLALSNVLKKKFFNKREQGANPVYSSINPYTFDLLSGNTVEWITNDGQLNEGDKYLKANVTTIGQVCRYLLKIDDDLACSNKKINVEVSYKSTNGAVVQIYQYNKNNIACNPNTVFTTTLLPSSDENVISLDGQVLSDAYYILVYVKFHNVGETKIGSIKVNILGTDNVSPISKEKLSNDFRQEFNDGVRFGNNPAYSTDNPWISKDATGSPSVEWLNNNVFFEGNKYLKITSTLATSGINTLINMPNRFGGKTNRKVLVTFNYISDSDFTFRVYQKKYNGNSCIPNSVIQKTIIKTSVEKTESIEVPILWDGFGLLPYLNIPSNANVLIGSIKCKIIGNDIEVIGGIEVVDVIVAKNGTGNFTTITDALNSILDASPSKQYMIYVKNDIYNEVNIRTKNYVDIIGEDRDKTIIRADGLTLPNIVWRDKSGLFVESISKLYNLTVDANDVKYCVHTDKGGDVDCYFENCYFIHRDGHCIGTGARYKQHQHFKDCIFENIGAITTAGIQDHFGVYWHNWNSQQGKTHLIMENCKSINCGIAWLTDVGSEYEDIAYIRHCTTNSLDKGIRFSSTIGHYIVAGETIPTTDYTKIPYNVKLELEGVVDLIEFDRTQRPLGEYHSLGNYDNYVFNTSGSILKAGMGVSIDYINSTNNIKVKLATNKINGVVIKDINNGDFGWIAIKGKTCEVLVGIEAFNRGDFVKCNTDGMFVKCNENEAMAVIIKPIGVTSENKLVKAKLLD